MITEELLKQAEVLAVKRLTEKYWRNLDPWECCGQNYYCERLPRDAGGCSNGCIVPKLYARLAAYEDTGLESAGVKLAVAALMGRDLAQIVEFNDVPIERLIELAKAEKDTAPLTLGELREMPLQEWLWVEIVHPTKRQQIHEVVSGYYRIYEDYTGGEALCCGFPGMIFEFEYDECGKNWMAYRRKPENSL